MNNERNSKGMSNQKKIIIIIAACVLAILIVVGIFLVVRLSSPEKTGLQGISGTMVGGDDDIYNQGGTVTLTEGEVKEQEITDNIVNVLLMGVDADYKPYAESGGDRHTDAIMVVAINLDKNKVDLISIPRYTFTYVPGVDGIYKMNAAVNTGGGVSAENGAGFLKTCEAVSWMLGGIDIDYYYALDFNAVVEIVNDMGGVDFEVDMNYQGQSGNVYKKGFQHLDGDGVMDYIRARKNATVNGTDKGRTDRQRRMMVALFKKIKEENMLSSIPKMISSVSNGLYTNTTTEQTLSLANYAAKINPEDIGMHSMEGKMNISMGSWAFCYTDQDNRVQLIKQIYGVEVSKYSNTTYKYATWLWDNGMLTTMKYLTNAENVAEQMVKNAGGTGSMSEAEKADYESLTAEIAKVQDAFNKAGSTLSASDTSAVKSAMSGLKKITESMASKYNYTAKLSWTVMADWTKDTGVNEVTVNFQ